MIEKIVYGAIGFIIGGLIGGGVVGHIITDELKGRIDDLESKNDKLTKELYELKSEKLKKKEETLNNKSAYDVKKIEVDNEDDFEETIEESEDDNDYNNAYEDLRTRYVSSKDKEDKDDIFDHATQIKRIDEQTYMNDLQYRDNEQLIYYQEDGTLVDSANDIIPNEVEIVGYEVMDMIDDTNDDFIYALDDLDNKMYEISVEHNLSYTRDVLGIGE